ncbi:ATP-binding protein [Aeromonas hydrophila]|uniref:ATP-binding protein n=1 Tax=Aeromonas hydrophila TaxID=644 RepID=UPI00140FCA2D|nr:ATP-binding protein [Aeromonas hydrophila]MCO4202039.1 ATP-binding protein [Aeromonas hydrophila]NHT35633.1 HAMP domain-containing protein [Aeromonas hydrophila]UNB58850.1 ATP-binding protein [Aeromonas hydrophila]
MGILRRGWSKLWPKGLTGQIILVALAGLVLIQLLSIQIYRTDREEALGYINSRNAMQRIVSVVRLLALSPPSLYDEIIKASRSETLLLRIADEPLQPDNRSPRFEQLVRSRLGYPSTLMVEISAELKQDAQRSRAWQHHSRMMKDRKGMPPPQDMRLYGSIQLPRGGWLQFSSLVDKESASWSWQTTLNLMLVASLVIGLMIWLFRRATLPLKQLAANADRLGRGEDIEPLREEGPTEVRESIQAFNRMHTRLDRFVQDRTRMLAAISHDLRTPITSLRLRTEFLDEGEDKERIQQTLQQMEQMLAATLSFAREEGQQEATRELDLVSLLESLCDDYADTGQPVTCLAEGKQVYACRANTLRRVLQNLIGNAIKYAGSAEVSLERTDSELVIRVCDQGPGIDPARLEDVFKPFVRLDEARNTESGSVGLGLSIARTLVHQHGGELTLHNRELGGLEARISLPL